MHNRIEEPELMDGSNAETVSCFEDKASNSGRQGSTRSLSVTVLSFGFKEGPPPEAQMMFDVRFLQNPFWIEELRELTGLEQPVQDYVLSQPLAQEFIEACKTLLEQLLPRLAEDGTRQFTIAIGCTGGQHRSVSVAEIITRKLRESCPDYMIRVCHRELDARAGTPEDCSNDSCSNAN